MKTDVVLSRAFSARGWGRNRSWGDAPG